jgi:hypothetical protein
MREVWVTALLNLQLKLKACYIERMESHRIFPFVAQTSSKLSNEIEQEKVPDSFLFQFPVSHRPARVEACTVFARSNTGIVGSNPTEGMDACVHLFCVCEVLYVDSGLATGWSPVQEVLPTVYRVRKQTRGRSPQGLQSHRWMDGQTDGCIDGKMDGWIDRQIATDNASASVSLRKPYISYHTKFERLLNCVINVI